ncbi:hypothetical protein [Methanosarcina sp. KYL-1]|uniref:hypothetical protein n=1 Tax=Methanosarcina sp. KYL-1 TaxID=2602068 RepID=UPI0021011F65|nr:hypothetical protein [Methanosarcina sp. KYL-1]
MEKLGKSRKTIDKCDPPLPIERKPLSSQSYFFPITFLKLFLEGVMVTSFSIGESFLNNIYETGQYMNELYY